MNTQDQAELPEELPSNVTPITTRTRKQRRAEEALQRRFQQRAAKHDCVLQRDCVDAGVAVYIEDEGEYHKLHTARGEPACGACPVCERFKTQGRPPTVFLASERDGIQRQWRECIEAAKVQREQEAKLAAEQAKVSGRAKYRDDMWQEPAAQKE